MPDWIIRLLDQWGAVTAAPIPFVIAIAIVGGLIWLAIGWSYNAVVNSKNAQIELLDRQIAALKESEPKGPLAAPPPILPRVPCMFYTAHG
jgi:hypothetical protein